MLPRKAWPHGLVARFTIMIAAVLLVAIGVFTVWNVSTHGSASEHRVLEQARVIDQQMVAVWDYIDKVQDYINYDNDGTYNFKHVYCAIAGKSIAQRVTQRTDCTIRYVRQDPRSGTDQPDAFEAEALDSFAGGATEYYGMDTQDGLPVFRYISRLDISYGCLSCHGGPAGEADVTGFTKEGYELGDTAGALSISIPMGPYQEEARQSALRGILLFAVLSTVIASAAGISLRHWVAEPLSSLGDAASKVGSGDFSSAKEALADASGLPREVSQLADEFSLMSAKLNTAYDDLENQVAERTAQLAQANEKLQEDNDAKSAFLATISHEMRAPLAAINALVDTWQRTPVEGKDEVGSLLAKIEKSSNALLATIDNSLDLTRIESQMYAVSLAPVDLFDVANEAEALALPVAGEKGVDLSTQIDPSLPLVTTDPSILIKILNNLLSNAIKFTESGGSVKLHMVFEISDGNHGPGMLVMAVSDTGIGMTPEEQGVVFERFKQANESTSRLHGGSGLGLSLVKLMSGLLGGTVSVQSAPGLGSTFTVRIPCDTVAETEYDARP